MSGGAGLRRRVARLAANAPASETPEWLRRMEERAEVPAEAAALWTHAFHRAARGGPGVDPLPAGGAEADAAEDRELEGLRAAVAAGGAEAGVGAWFAEEDGWPDLGWPGGEAGLAFYVEEARRELLALRSCPALAAWRARTGWREGLAPDEEAAFERRCLDQAGAAR